MLGEKARIWCKFQTVQPLGPGTIDDLIADAKASGYVVGPRLITDWVSLGLLDRPVRRSLGRGRGSDKALYSGNQRKLLVTLLHHRKSVRNISTLAKIPLALWVYYGDEYVSLEQAKRAFRTWLGDYRTSRERAEWSAREMLAQLDNPEAAPADRRRLRQALADIAYTGELDMTALEDAVSAVFEPRISLLRRAVGPPGALITVDVVMSLIQARLAAAKLLRDGRITDVQLKEARQAHIAHSVEYEALRPQFADQAGPELAGLFKPVTFEEKVNTCCVDLLTILGLRLRSQQ